MNYPTEKHLFSFYYKSFKCSHSCASELILDDPQLCNRMSSIVRLQVDDECIIFNHTEHAHLKITAVAKKQIRARCISHASNNILYPAITYALPLIKREALENALDSLTQLGATEIQLLTTQKVQRSNPKEFDRLERIIHAAAEQSKNFSFPLLKKPCTLEELFILYPDCSIIVFHPTGQPLSLTIEKLKANNPTHLLLISGPEGDFTQEEMKLIKRHNGIFTALTPTILRAELAAALGLGIIRSFL